MSIYDIATEPIEFGGYADIRPILDVLLKFVQKILEIYLPTDVQDVITDIEAM